MQDFINAVEKNRNLILDAERYIWAHPETGYKEFETSKYMEEKFIALGYELVKPKDITGFVTTLDTKKDGPTILILGELDSIICPSHPESNKQTGAVHSCGHNAQCAALLGIAAALKEPGILDKFCGKIKLCAVPAEELLEITFRLELMEKGIIKFFGGKPEFMARGLFDDVDIAFMLHTTSGTNFITQYGSNGCLAKRVIYKGVAAHAGGSPWNGKNALYAATCGINACNAIRETFEEKDTIRFHPIITNGGAMVNAIPESAELESYVRGRTFDAILKNNKKLNQALIGAALSLDNNVEIVDNPGYAPLNNDKNMIEVTKQAHQLIFPDRTFDESPIFGTGSTDMGDLSCVMPVIHPYAPGAVGTCHGNNYYIENPELACVDSAKMQLSMLYVLLKDNAKRAKEVIAQFKPMFPSIKAYLDFCDSIMRKGDRINYGENKVEIEL